MELDIVGTLATMAGGNNEAEMWALSLLTGVADARVVPVGMEHLDGRSVLQKFFEVFCRRPARVAQ